MRIYLWYFLEKKVLRIAFPVVMVLFITILIFLVNIMGLFYGALFTSMIASLISGGLYLHELDKNKDQPSFENQAEDGSIDGYVFKKLAVETSSLILFIIFGSIFIGLMIYEISVNFNKL